MADLIPRNVLFGNPERVSPHISPDGTRLAWIAPRDGVQRTFGEGGFDFHHGVGPLRRHLRGISQQLK